MAWYLDAAREDEVSSVRVILGDYGSGKTHFLRMTSHMALERRFFVSEVTLSRDVRLDRFDTVWRGLLASLASPESRGKPEGIQEVLNRWCSSLAEEPEEVDQRLGALDDINGLDPDFRQALRGYANAYFTQGDRDSYLQWLKGDAVRPPGIRAKIDRASARAMLRSLILFLKHIGYSGLVLFLDELELIRDQGAKARDANYDVLRQFVDDADNLPSFLLLCSVTPQMITDDNKGFPSYPALWQRLGRMMNTIEGDYRALVVDLSRSSLRDEDLVELALKIRQIYLVAMGMNVDERVPSSFIQNTLIPKLREQESELPMIRRTVSTTIAILETLDQNPNMRAEEVLAQALNKAVEDIYEQEQRRHRNW